MDGFFKNSWYRFVINVGREFVGNYALPFSCLFAVAIEKDILWARWTYENNTLHTSLIERLTLSGYFADAKIESLCLKTFWWNSLTYFFLPNVATKCINVPAGYMCFRGPYLPSDSSIWYRATTNAYTVVQYSSVTAVRQSIPFSLACSCGHPLAKSYSECKRYMKAHQCVTMEIQADISLGPAAPCWKVFNIILTIWGKKLQREVLSSRWC